MDKLNQTDVAPLMSDGSADNRADMAAKVATQFGSGQMSERERLLAEDIMRAMGHAGVPCGAVQDTGEVLADPHLKAREMIVDLEYGRRGVYQTVGCPIKLSASPAEITRPPELGEHTDDVLRELLQVSEDDIARLHQDNVV